MLVNALARLECLLQQVIINTLPGSNEDDPRKGIFASKRDQTITDVQESKQH